jgi:hypothetical protein
VRLSSKLPFVLIIGVLLAAGCGSVTAAPPATRSSAALAVSGKPTGSPQQRATADVKAMLGEFVPPPGAVRLAKKPALPSGSATMLLNSTAQADVTGYWRVNGSATVLQAWEKAHIARGFSRQDVIIGPPDWNTVYSLSAVPGLFPVREMNVQFYDVGGGATVIMAEAMVEWQPPRPATETIPDSVTLVTIAKSGSYQGKPAPVTITSVPVVRRLAALVNGLPLSTAGNDVPCASGGVSDTLTFRAVKGGPPVAVTGPGGCDWAMSLRLNGKDEPALQAPESFDGTVEKIAGLHWAPSLP